MRIAAISASLILLVATPAIAAPPDADAGSPSPAAGDDTEGLAKKAQNPIANLISVPVQNNTNFSFGPRERKQNVLNIQPVIPFKLSDDWNLITRWIVPIVHQPSLFPGDSENTGLGDINPSFFLATSVAPKLMVGAGPTFLLDTATHDDLGTGKWGAGPSAVFVWMPGHWLVGGLVNNIWSFAGDADRQKVNSMLVQPFVNYNFPKGWYLTTSPVVTANWRASAHDTWTVPVGGGFGRVMRLGKLPINTQIQGFRYVEKPKFGPNWLLRVQIQLLFPKG